MLAALVIHTIYRILKNSNENYSHLYCCVHVFIERM
jgi:hypothetical protein